MTEERQYVSSALSCTITDFNEKYHDGKLVTFYTIKLVNHFSKIEWTIDKRYSEFESISKELIKIVSDVPDMPKKTVFKVSAFEELQKRQLELEHFIQGCVNRQDIMNNNKFRTFLDIEQHFPELTVNPPILEGEYKNLPLGVRDFHYDKTEGVLFICCSDMNIISRTDSMIANIKFPWDKKTEKNSQVPLGGAFCYRVQKLGIGWQFVKSWVKSFPSQTGVINWDSTSNIFSIGLDDGRIFVMKHESKSNFSQFSELTEIKPHKDRVMGIGFDSKTSYIYSCSTDKLFLISDLNYLSTPIEVAKGNSGYTNLNFDKNSNRIFLTNEGGEIEVFTTNTSPLSRILLLQTRTTSCIRGLDIDLKKKMIFTANIAGKISVLDLGIPGKEHLMTETSHFGCKAKLRIIRSNSERNEVITGDEEGRVSIWDLKNGEPIYAWEAHDKTPITQMIYDEETKLLWTGGKDYCIKIWKLPTNWYKDEIENFKKTEMKAINDNIAKERIQKLLSKANDDDESDSEEDDLNGWELDK